MIPISRCAEPPRLALLRDRKLAELRKLNRAPRSDDITGYAIVAGELWRSQHYKCSYCEQKVREHYNDVDHYRPKARARRDPGSPLTHGYWWLAFTWENMLFSCPSCNRSRKMDQFPLDHGSTPLAAEEVPPGMEQVLLLDPAGGENPMCHIQFVESVNGHWRAEPRGSSRLGRETIRVLGLNAQDLLELRGDYFSRRLAPQLALLQDAASNGSEHDMRRQFAVAHELLRPSQEFVGLAFDAIAAGLPSAYAEAGLHWPTVEDVGRTISELARRR